VCPLGLVATGEPNVAIILGYYDGHRFIGEQLESIFAQTHRNLHVFVCDDASPVPLDLESLGLDSDSRARVTVLRREENLGFARNFLYGLEDAGCDFDYYAFSDQDDVWYPDKVNRAIGALVGNSSPALYCSRTEAVDAACARSLGYSPLFVRPPSFANALVQSIAGGNTMVLNCAARDLVLGPVGEGEVVSHDWSCYQIISGAGGFVFYDPMPSLKYRQHGGNEVGSNMSWRSRLVRLGGLLSGRFRGWNDANVRLLLQNRELLTGPSEDALDSFIEARNSGLIARVRLFFESGVYRQTRVGSVALWLAIVLNRV
jgi:glycosyltransferase involved in cell wall biosynthesis